MSEMLHPNSLEQTVMFLNYECTQVFVFCLSSTLHKVLGCSYRNSPTARGWYDDIYLHCALPLQLSALYSELYLMVSNEALSHQGNAAYGSCFSVTRQRIKDITWTHHLHLQRTLTPTHSQYRSKISEFQDGWWPWWCTKVLKACADQLSAVRCSGWRPAAAPR